MSTPQDVVTKVCAVPSDLHQRGDVSVVRLLQESGYEAVRGAVSAPAIQQHLETHPHLIDEWAVYSNDKRRSSGWYFDDSRYSTGHFSSAAGRTREQVFSERSRACAEFIKHELDSILENVA